MVSSVIMCQEFHVITKNVEATARVLKVGIALAAQVSRYESMKGENVKASVIFES